MGRHRDLTSPGAIHPAAFVGASDPGTVGAHKFWVDTSSGPPYTLYKRTALDDDWETVGGGGGSSAAASITIADAANDFAATNVEDALAELQSFDETFAITLSSHEADTTSIHGITDTATLYRSGGTDVAVADGGTGASTASAARDNLGLGTANSPQFTAVNIGNATDTTITRDSAGVLAVEGKTVYMAAGTDVAVTDGGTGASTAALARANLGAGLAITVIRPSISANQNNWAPTGLVPDTIIQPNLNSADRTITGISATGMTDGSRVWISLAGASQMLFSHASGSSSAANQIACPGATTYTVTDRAGVCLWYDASATLWRILDK